MATNPATLADIRLRLHFNELDDSKDALITELLTQAKSEMLDSYGVEEGEHKDFRELHILYTCHLSEAFMIPEARAVKETTQSGIRYNYTDGHKSKPNQSFSTKWLDMFHRLLGDQERFGFIS